MSPSISLTAFVIQHQSKQFGISHQQFRRPQNNLLTRPPQSRPPRTLRSPSGSALKVLTAAVAEAETTDCGGILAGSAAILGGGSPPERGQVCPRESVDMRKCGDRGYWISGAADSGNQDPALPAAASMRRDRPMWGARAHPRIGQAGREVRGCGARGRAWLRMAAVRDSVRGPPENPLCRNRPSFRFRLTAHPTLRHSPAYFTAGWSSLVARWAHNPKVGGSNPPPATNCRKGPGSRFRAFFH